MKKSFEISAKISTDEFDRNVEQMQKKLKDLYEPGNQMRAQAATAGKLQQQGFGGLSAPTQEAFQKATQQQRRDQDSLIREQATGQEKLGKLIAARVEKLKELKDQQSQMVKDSEKELALKEKIARVEENTSKMREMYKSRDALLNQTLDARANPPNMPPYPKTQPYTGPANSTVNSGWNMNLLGGARGIVAGGAGILGGIGALGGMASNVYRSFGNAPIQTAGNLGNAAQNTVGRDVGNVYGGRSSFEGMFNEERMKALGMSKNAMDTGRTSDKADLLSSILKQGAAGAAGGAIGGSFIPGLGTLAGAAIGGVGGAANAVFGNSKNMSLALSPFSSTMSKRYESTLAQEFGQNYQTSYQGLKDQNPNKKYALEHFEGTMDRDLQAQRSMGLSDQELTGDSGYFKRTTDAGFRHEKGLGMSSAILGAGGSSRMAKESQFGLQMERSGLTNAGGILGSLSSSIQSPDSSKRATIEIMSEAMSAGLDNSEFAEENRKFTQAAANIIGQTGAKDQGDQGNIAQTLASFLADRTNAGVQGAKSAYDEFQGKTSELGGRRGTLRMVGAMKDPRLEKLSQQEKIEFLSIQQKDFNKDNPEAVFFAQKTGQSIEDLKKSHTQADRQGMYEEPGQLQKIDQIRAKLKDYAKKTGKSPRELVEQIGVNTDKDFVENFASGFGELQATQRRTEGGDYDPTKSKANAIRELQDEGSEKILGPFDPNRRKVDEQLTGVTRNRDKFEQGAAGDSEAVRKNFNEMSGDIDKAAESAAKMSGVMRQAAMDFSATIAELEKNKNSDAMNSWISKYATTNPTTQSQAGKGKQ